MGPILVVGATGFIGQHLVCRLLASGLAVRGIAREEIHGRPFPEHVEIIKADIRNLRAVREGLAGIETVFHLAGKVRDLEQVETTDEHEEVTVNGTHNVMTAAIGAGVKKVIYFSSLSVYGNGCHDVTDESAPCKPITGYGRAKLKAEHCVLEEGANACIHVSCLRPAMVYGAGCRGNLPRMIKLIDMGMFPPVPDCPNHRSMAHVSNVVEAAILAATKPQANGQVYNVTDARAYSTREIYELICRGLGKKFPRWQMPIWALKILARLGDAIGRLRGRRFLFDSDAFDKLIGSACYSSEKITRELGYRPSVTFEDALPELITWYRKS